MHNDVQRLRERQNFSREQLGRMVGVTRQSIALIETGRMCPSTQVALRLAKVLGTRVEDLFFDDEATPDETTIPLYKDSSFIATKRAYLSTIGGQRLARSQAPVSALSGPPAHAVMGQSATRDAQAVIPLYEPSALPATVFVSGCEIGLSLLTQYVTARSHRCQGVWFNVTNQQALLDLAQGGCHVAAVHLPKDTPPARLSLGRPVTAFHFATAELGWMVARGNPLGFHDAQRLADGRIRLVNRPAGAGARHVLDEALRRAGVEPIHVLGYRVEVAGHFDVADAIAKGFADVGIGHAGAAALCGLDFIPMQTEQCTLLIRDDAIQDDAVQALLEALHSDRFRTDLTAIGPYDATHAGAQCS